LSARRLRAPALAGAMWLAACGGGSTPSTPTNPDNPNQMVISASGTLTPTELVVTPGSRVLFVNNHSRPHQMASDPHPEHNDCPEFDQVGLLAPGQRRETGNLVTARTCGLHDHIDPDNASLKGRVVIR
jgi:plastocyanin